MSNIENKVRDGFELGVSVAFNPDSGKILAFHIGKGNDFSYKTLMKNLVIYKLIFTALMIGSPIGIRCQKYHPSEKHIIDKAKITHIERRNRDLNTHLKRICREIFCFSKKDDMHYGVMNAYFFLRNKFGSLVKTEHTF